MQKLQSENQLYLNNYIIIQRSSFLYIYMISVNIDIINIMIHSNVIKNEINLFYLFVITFNHTLLTFIINISVNITANT